MNRTYGSMRGSAIATSDELSFVQTQPPAKARLVRAIQINALLAALVTLCWAAFGRQLAWQNLIRHWQVALTMVLGSTVGGGTSEGGAAVAFPVFTKVLHIAPGDARLFSFAIQTVGMGSASLSILYQRQPIERRVLPWTGIGGIVGMILSTYLLLPHVPPVVVRVAFTVVVTSLGLMLLFLDRHRGVLRHEQLPVFEAREKVLLLVAGLVGGALSGMIGCGENIVAFLVMVLLFRVSEKVVTPTTVLLMSMVTASAFVLHLFVLRDFSPAAMSYWLAAVPVAAIFAPFGALVCSYLSRRAIVYVLVALIAVEFTSTVLLVPMSPRLRFAAFGSLCALTLLNWAMSRVRRYDCGQAAYLTLSS